MSFNIPISLKQPTGKEKGRIQRAISIPLAAGLLLALTGSFLGAPSTTALAQMDTPVPTMTSVTVFSLSVANNPVQVGDTFDLNVDLETDQETRTAQVELLFDPKLVEILDVVEGDFYKTYADEYGASTLLSPPKVEPDNVNGRVPVQGVSLMGGPMTGSQGMVGKGVLLTYHVRAKANGEASFSFGNVRIFDNGYSGKLMSMGGVKTQDLNLVIGGEATAVQPTPRSQDQPQSPQPTAVLKPTAALEQTIRSGGSVSIPWIIGIPIVGLLAIGVMVALTRKK